MTSLEFDIDGRFASNVKILKHPKWLEEYKEDKKGYPICWEVDVSNNCPYGCEHCCWGKYISGHHEVMPREKLLILMREIKDLGGKSIIWSGGGDPLTNHCITEVVQFSHDLGIENAMFTNGLGMNSKRAEVLAKTLVWIRFHVGADNARDFSRIHGVPESFFDVAIKNIGNFIKVEGRTANVGIGVPVNENNFEATKKLPELAMELGADFFQAKLIFVI